MRTETAYSRIKEYLSGEIDRIEELDEKRLPFDGRENVGEYDLRWRKYEHIASPHVNKWWV